MTLHWFVFKSHKWLAVGVGIFTLMWFATGVVMELPKGAPAGSGGAAAKNAAKPDYKGITITVPQAIAAAEEEAIAKLAIQNVELRPLEGRLYYQISTTNAGTHLIDAVSGTPLEITEEFAKQRAAGAAAGRGQARGTGLVLKHSMEYAYGPLPAYRMAFDDPAATLVFVSANTGETTMSDRNGRVRGFIAGMHTFEFLKPQLSNRSVRALLVLTSFVGLWMSVFGGWILLLQFQSWRARRAGRTVEA